MPIQCKEDNCDKRALFNLPNNSPIFCASHKNTDMINTSCKTCLKENCYKQPSFNLPNEKVGLYCFEHKIEGCLQLQIYYHTLPRNKFF